MEGNEELKNNLPQEEGMSEESVKNQGTAEGAESTEEGITEVINGVVHHFANAEERADFFEELNNRDNR